MAKRRTTVKVELDKSCKKLTWEEAVGQFLDSLKIKGLSYHTIRWHKENLIAISKVMKKLDMSTEPGLINEKMIQDVVLDMICFR